MNLFSNMLYSNIVSIIILFTLKESCVKTLSTNGSCTISNPVSVWRKEDYPNPGVDVGRCGRRCKKSWICDPSKIISEFQAERLDDKILLIASSGDCKCSQCAMDDGYNISIALVPRMSISSGSTKRAEAKRFGDYLRKKWGFQKCGNNVLIFISQHDREVYTAAGPYAYKTLTLKKIEQVYKEVKPILSRGDFTAGLSQMLTRYQEIFSNAHEDEDEGYSPLEIAGICLIVLVSLCIVGGCCFYHIVSTYCQKKEPELSDREQRKQSANILRDYYKNRKYKPKIVYEQKTEDTRPSSSYSSRKVWEGGRSSYNSRSGYSSVSRYTSSYRSRHTDYSSSYGGGGGGSSEFSGGDCSDGGGGGGGDF